MNVGGGAAACITTRASAPAVGSMATGTTAPAILVSTQLIDSGKSGAVRVGLRHGKACENHHAQKNEDYLFHEKDLLNLTAFLLVSRKWIPFPGFAGPPNGTDRQTL